MSADELGTGKLLAMGICTSLSDPELNEQQTKKAPKLIDWEQNFAYIVAPINRVIGQEIRAIPYLHWWSFISAYYEIGDCLFAQIVSIRNKKARGKKLDKWEQEFYQNNRALVDLKTKYTDEENDVLNAWLGKLKPVPSGAGGHNVNQ